MGEEFQGGVCGGNWWSSSRNFFGSSPCSLASNDPGSFGWHSSPDLFIDTKAGPGDHHDSDGGRGGSMQLLQNVQNPSSGGGMPVESFHGWNQDLLHDGGRSDENYSKILQEPAAGMNYQQQTKIDYPQIPNSSECSETCQGLSSGFPLNSTSYTCASSLLQTLFDTDQPVQSLLDNQGMNYTTEFLAGLPEVVPPVENSMFEKQHLADHDLPVAKNAPLWNTTAATLMSDVRGNFLPSTQPQYLPSVLNNSNRQNIPSFNSKRPSEAAMGLSSKKASSESTPKRPRIETPSPLPTFKVRKEKLGDRITALQQLVSPFGKTDTASVLHEAIEYIKFLHDQVSALCTPYLKNGPPQALQHQLATDGELNDQQGQFQDLRRAGLCLVPISSTFPVADAATDFWNPSFGGSFKL